MGADQIVCVDKADGPGGQTHPVELLLGAFHHEGIIGRQLTDLRAMHVSAFEDASGTVTEVNVFWHWGVGRHWNACLSRVSRVATSSGPQPRQQWYRRLLDRPAGVGWLAARPALGRGPLPPAGAARGASAHLCGV